eukprot:329562-Amphidinium_carterae.3
MHKAKDTRNTNSTSHFGGGGIRLNPPFIKKECGGAGNSVQLVVLTGGGGGIGVTTLATLPCTTLLSPTPGMGGAAHGVAPSKTSLLSAPFSASLSRHH